LVLSFYPRKKTASMEEEDDGRSIVKEASLPRLVQRDSHRVLKKNKNNKKLIQAILLWVLLIVLGGLVFHVCEFEGREEDVRQQELHFELVKEFFQHNDTVLAFLNEHYTVFDDSTYAHNWGYSDSIFFAFTLFTTIGYGSTSPHTWWGQFFVIVFSVASIPVAGAVIMFSSGRALHLLRVAYTFVKNKLKSYDAEKHNIEKAFQQLNDNNTGTLDIREFLDAMKLLEIPYDVDAVREYFGTKKCVNLESFSGLVRELDLDIIDVATRSAQLKIAVAGLSVLFAMLVFLLHSIEGWTFWKSFYFSFVTLTTVGLGDVVPQSIPGQLITMAFAMLGLGLLSIILGLLGSEFYKRSKMMRRRAERARGAVKEKLVASKKKFDKRRESVSWGWTTNKSDDSEKLTRDAGALELSQIKNSWAQTPAKNRSFTVA
jgi:voltage-gated potassium channel Kch